jgi:hypothetical protein
MMAPSKSEKETSQFQSLKGKKGKKQKKTETKGDEFIDFSMIKRFNSLKITAPLNSDGLQKTIDDLKELKDALSYWGKIIQRQAKIKYIKTAKKISQVEEIINMAEEEENYIFNEKTKFDSEQAEQETHLKLDKLKLAQQIDKELRVKVSVHQDDHTQEEVEQN